jgi:hypothetical protein
VSHVSLMIVGLLAVVLIGGAVVALLVSGKH